MAIHGSQITFKKGSVVCTPAILPETDGGHGHGNGAPVHRVPGRRRQRGRTDERHDQAGVRAGPQHG